MTKTYLYYGVVLDTNGSAVGIKIGETSRHYQIRWYEINQWEKNSHNGYFVGIKALTLYDVDTATRRGLEDFVRDYIAHKNGYKKYGKDHFSGKATKSLATEIMKVAKKYCDSHNMKYARVTAV